VLVAGSGAQDRDETVFNIPIFGQLAGALADAGFLVVRYDKRGVGQSGGRGESATLADYAEDVRAVVKYLSERKDVDKKHIAAAESYERYATPAEKVKINAAADKAFPKRGQRTATHKKMGNH